MRATVRLLLWLTLAAVVTGCSTSRLGWRTVSKSAEPPASTEPAKADDKPAVAEAKPKETTPAETPFKPSTPSTNETPVVAAKESTPAATNSTTPTTPQASVAATVTPAAGATPGTSSPATPDVAQKSAATGLTADTLRLIDQELQDATPDERAEWYAQLKRVDPAVIPEILRARRLSLQTASLTPDAPESATASPFGSRPPSMNERTADASPYAASSANPAARNPAAPSMNALTPPAMAKAEAGMGWGNPWGTSAANGPAAQNEIFGVVPAGHSPATPGLTTAGYAPSEESSGGPQHAIHRADDQTRPEITFQNYEVAPSAAQNRPATLADSPQAQPTGVPWPPAKPGAPNSTLDNVTSHLPFGSGFVQNVVGLVPGRGVQTANAATAVAPASAIANPEPGSSAWQQQLSQTIAYLEQEVAVSTPGATDEDRNAYIRKHVALRMLYLMANQQERALTAIPDIEPAEQEFWQQLMWGMINSLDAEHLPQAKDRANQTITQLNNAIRRLQEQADLQIRHVAFCRQILYFGSYEKMPRNEFSPGQEVLLYAEIDNFKSEPTAEGQYRTLLRSTIEILSPSGELRKQIEFPATEDLCGTYRRDYFHNYQFRIPERMPLGPHVVKLTVFDELSDKMISHSLNFLVK